jgi:hypothetical protein
LAVALFAGGCANRGPSPAFRQDLRKWGFATDATDVAANYTDINFLTDDLLLVNTATQREFPPVESLPDQIASKLLLFNLLTGNLVKTATFPVDKSSQSVRATQNGQFVVLNLSGVHACSVDLSCSTTFSTSGPLLVSPGGTRLLVGGYGRSEERVLDSKTLRELSHFASRLGRPVQIGDHLLLIDGDQVVDESTGKPCQSFFATDADAQFLNDDTLAGYANRMNGPSKVVVRRLSGTIVYQIALDSEWQDTRLITSTSGRRFCVDERGYTRWSLPHLLGYGGGSVHYNFERVRVFDTDSGRELFDLEWDPRPYTGGLVAPALSPNGHHIGIVRHGSLEVFNVP